MRTLSKVIGVVLLTILSLVVGLWPEALGFALYSYIAPVTELGKIALALGLVFVGGGLSVLMAWLGLAMWIAGVATIVGQ